MKSLICLLSVPLLAQQGVNFYSLEKERALGMQMAAEVRKSASAVTDAAIQEYVHGVGGALAPFAKEPAVVSHFSFEVISSADRTEPFSTPGGSVFVPVRALVAAEDEAEFVGMLAHAIGHAALRHGTRSATRAQVVNMASVPLIYMGSWAGPHVDMRRSAESPMPLGALKFQRVAELEADRFAVDTASKAGYDPAGLLRYVERVQTDTQPASSALPSKEERIASLQRAVASLTAQPARPSSEEFEKARAAARSVVNDAAPERRPPTLRR